MKGLVVLVILVLCFDLGFSAKRASAADYARLANPALRQAAAVTDAHLAAWRDSSHRGALAGHCTYRATVTGETAIVTVTCGWTMGAIARDSHGAWRRLS